jgi:nucleoside-diphosphate-sugar epimerase
MSELWCVQFDNGLTDRNKINRGACGEAPVIVVTGSAGLIGRSIVKSLRSDGFAVREFDFRTSSQNDLLHRAALERALQGAKGVIHLAAVSRVVWAQNYPELARRVNVEGLQSLLDLALRQEQRPWVVFASSREVYGEQSALPVREDAALAPMNYYAVTKADGEILMNQAREAGLLTAILRFSNVYGSVDDHHDRVVPAFARCAARGGTIRVEGGDNTFDFTFVDDVVDGLRKLIDALESGTKLPPLHLVSGRSTSLRELARLAVRTAAAPVTVLDAAPRAYDVAHFCGNPHAAKHFLGWQAGTTIETGFARLVYRFRIAASAPPAQSGDRCRMADWSEAALAGLVERLNLRITAPKPRAQLSQK